MRFPDENKSIQQALTALHDALFETRHDNAVAGYHERSMLLEDALEATQKAALNLSKMEALP